MSHSDGRVAVFTATSDKPYDRHSYRVIYANGKGQCRGPQDFTTQRRYRKADRVKHPIELI